MSESGIVKRGIWFVISPAWLLDWLIRDPKRRFFASEWIIALWVLPFFTLLGLAVMAVFPTVLILIIWGILSLVLSFDIKSWVMFILYVVFLFSAGWGLGNGIRDIVRQANQTWERDGDEIRLGGYSAYRLRKGRWV
jgi:hypothetical protein